LDVPKAIGGASLPLRPYGFTGLHVTALGFGAMQAGAPEIPDAEAARLLHGALDLGIRLIDTARSYGVSEERIGRHLERRRDEYVLSTKLGYGVDGVPDWTPECVRRGVDAARDRLRTDVIDVVHLHSCPQDVLLHSGVVDALAEAVQARKVRVAAYSGENDALDHAIASSSFGRPFGAVQLSVNVCESHALARACAASERGLGVLAKRPFAGLPWRHETPPEDPPHAEYWRRFQSLRALAPADWKDLALRYAAHAPGVAGCLVGGTSLAHLQANVAAVARGAPSAEELASLDRVHRGVDWQGVI
jgi:aryl-alcohol dehydrogenase-like predicted oxidoreductase